MVLEMGRSWIVKGLEEGDGRLKEMGIMVL